MTVLRSRDNPRIKRWRRLAIDARFRKKEGRALVEGPHLVAAAGARIQAVMVTEDALKDSEIRSLAVNAIVLSASVFRAIVDTETPQGIAAEVEILPARPGKGDSVFLEGIQDAGNVGAILRSAAAFGVRNIYLDRHCADPWSPKVLRAAAGGHFQLSILEGKPPDGSRLICTVARNGVALKDADLAGPLCWVFGSEGKGVSPEMQGKAAVRVTIPIDPGTESLNVAAAAAICLYASRRGSRP